MRYRASTRPKTPLFALPSVLLLGLLYYRHQPTEPQTFAVKLLSQPRPTARIRAVLILHENQFNGLGAQLLRQLDALALASHLRRSFTPCFGRYWNYGCAPYTAWQCYFVPSAATSSDTCDRMHTCAELADLDVSGISTHDCIVISTEQSANRAAAVMQILSRGQKDLPRSLAKRIWQLNSRTRNLVDTLLREAGVPLRHDGVHGKYIGVHVRRGDKRKEVPLIPLRRYAEAVRKLVKDAKVPVFIAGDDGTSVRALRELLSGWKILAVRGAEGRTGHDQARMNRGYMKRNYERVVELLAEIEALAGSSVFVGTFSSNLGRFVHVLREGEGNSSVSLDDRWAPGTAWRTFGQRYCEASEANEVYCEKRQ